MNLAIQRGGVGDDRSGGLLTPDPSVDRLTEASALRHVMFVWPKRV